MSASATRRSWRPRFTLAALLVLITIVAIPLGHVAYRRHWNEQRIAAIELFTSRQANIVEDRVPPSGYLPDSPKRETSRAMRWWNELCKERTSEEIKRIAWSNDVTQEDVGRLRYFPELEEVDLWLKEDVPESAMGTIARLPNLRILSLRNSQQVTGEFLNRLIAKRELHSLSLDNVPKLQGQALRSVGEMEKLSQLSLCDCESLDDESLRQFNIPASLAKLQLVRLPVGDETVMRLLSQAPLDELSLSVPISRHAIPIIAAQKHLRRLQLGRVAFVDDDLKFLDNLEKLDQLGLHLMPVRGDFLSKLSKPERFTQLNFSSTLFSDHNIEAFARFPNLRSIALSWTPITGEGFAALQQLPERSDLLLCGTELSEAGKSAVASIRGPHTVVLPANWASLDFDRFPLGAPPYHCASVTLPRNVVLIKGGSVTKVSLRNLGLVTKWSSDIPVELLAPVKRLHEAGLARSLVDEKDAPDE
jgi:hypothetical protein